MVDAEAPGNTATLKAELFTRAHVMPAGEEEMMEKNIVDKKKEIQKNINRTHEVQEDSRLNVLNRQVN